LPFTNKWFNNSFFETVYLSLRAEGVAISEIASPDESGSQ